MLGILFNFPLLEASSAPKFVPIDELEEPISCTPVEGAPNVDIGGPENGLVNPFATCRVDANGLKLLLGPDVAPKTLLDEDPVEDTGNIAGKLEAVPKALEGGVG